MVDIFTVTGHRPCQMVMVDLFTVTGHRPCQMVMVDIFTVTGHRPCQMVMVDIFTVTGHRPCQMVMVDISTVTGHPVGSVGDSYDNALAETITGLYKTELIRQQGPWRNIEAVEFATLTWVDWFNNRRLLEPIGSIPPAELEMAYYQQLQELARAA